MSKWALFIAVSLLILAGSLAPARWMQRLPNDKIMHFCAYALLTGLAWQITFDSTTLLYWAIALALAGWTVELIQNLVPGRRFCWHDVMSNIAGILAVYLGCELFSNAY